MQGGSKSENDQKLMQFNPEEKYKKLIELYQEFTEVDENIVDHEENNNYSSDLYQEGINDCNQLMAKTQTDLNYKKIKNVLRKCAIEQRMPIYQVLLESIELSEKLISSHREVDNSALDSSVNDSLSQYLNNIKEASKKTKRTHLEIIKLHEELVGYYNNLEYILQKHSEDQDDRFENLLQIAISQSIYTACATALKDKSAAGPQRYNILLEIYKKLQLKESNFEKALKEYQGDINKQDTTVYVTTHINQYIGLSYIKYDAEFLKKNQLQQNKIVGLSLLNIICITGNYRQLLSLYYFKKKELNIFIQDTRKLIAIHYAISFNHVEIVKFLMPKTGVDYIDSKYTTLLFHAIYHRVKDIVKLLIDKGANVYFIIQGQNNCKPLDFAVTITNGEHDDNKKQDYKDIICILIESGAQCCDTRNDKIANDIYEQSKKEVNSTEVCQPCVESLPPTRSLR